MVRHLLLICSCLASCLLYAQRNEPFQLVSLSQLTEKAIDLDLPSIAIKSAVSYKTISVIDKRHDTYKVGFLPFYKNFPKLLRLNQNLPAWVNTVIGSSIQPNENESRDLLVVIKKFWFSHEAYQKFAGVDVVLHYNLEVYSVINSSYYPVKRIEGNFKTAFEEGCYKELGHSFCLQLQKDMSLLNYVQKEVPANMLDSSTVFNYYNKRLERIPQRYEIPTGVFASYEDFLQRRVISDSVDVIKHYDYFLKSVISCRLGVFINGKLQSCNDCWGYYNGMYLYMNTGKGLFVKLLPWHDQFILADILQMAITDDKNGVYDKGMIGNSAYEDIKSVSRIYQLFYQLDYDNGKLL